MTVCNGKEDKARKLENVEKGRGEGKKTCWTLASRPDTLPEDLERCDVAFSPGRNISMIML